MKSSISRSAGFPTAQRRVQFLGEVLCLVGGGWGAIRARQS